MYLTLEDGAINLIAQNTMYAGNAFLRKRKCVIYLTKYCTLFDRVIPKINIFTSGITSLNNILLFQSVKGFLDLGYTQGASFTWKACLKP